MPAVESLERRITGSGYRLTAPRRALLQTLMGLGDRFTAEQVVEGSPGVGRATVFRSLRLLQEIGVICQVVLDDGATAYRLTSGGHHHHMSCTECGAVNDFSGCNIDDLLEELARRTGYQVDAHRLEVYGLCSSCREALTTA